MKMKKTGIVFLTSVILTGCAASSTSTVLPSTEAVSTLAPDEVQAGSVVLKTKTLDMSEYQYLDDEDPAFVQITFDEMLRLFEEDGTGVVLLSYETCPWCNRAVPVLDEAAKAEGIQVFYVDIYEDEMVKDKTEEEWNEALDTFYSYADSILKHETNEETGESEPVLYVPLVIGIKNGEITGSHTSLVSSFTLTDETVQLTAAQHEELLADYEDIIESIR